MTENRKQGPGNEKSIVRSVTARIILLLTLIAIGVLVTYKNSPLNILNLFNRPVNDQASVQRVKEQASESTETMHTVEVAGNTLTVPSEFKVEVFAEGRGKLRMMSKAPDDYLFVTEMDKGNVLAYALNPNLPVFGQPMVAISGLDTPSGITFHYNSIWVAEQGQVSRFAYMGGGRVGEKEVVVFNLPAGGNHVTRTIGFGPDGKLYVAIGSSCNVCEEKDKRRAAIIRYNPDGSGEEIFAEGLRNTVGFVWHPETQEIWGVDNGRDLIGDDIPPEEVNVIMQGKHYGWPYCYGRGLPNPEYKNRLEFCQSTEFPIVEMQAHSAPLGLRFYEGGSWPDRYKQNLFIAFHGSWNRTVPTGYKIVRVDKDLKVGDFITGWLKPDGKAWGRPVDILFVDDDMFITDDAGGRIYKVSQK